MILYFPSVLSSIAPKCNGVSIFFIRFPAEFLDKSKKNSTPVIVPQVLSLHDASSTDSASYRLKASILHHGIVSKSGHYSTLAFFGAETPILHYNDSVVRAHF